VAYAYGGAKLTIAAIEDLVPVRVHYYVKLGAESFSRLIDAAGGVWVDVEKDLKYRDSWAGLDIDLKKGPQQLDGARSMAYARFRHDALGDIGRASRQQQVIQALFRRMRDPDVVWRAPQILEAISRNTETNLRPNEVLTLAWFMKNRGGDAAATVTLPGRFAPLYWEPDPAAIRGTVLEMFYGLKADVAAGLSVQVINESGVQGVGRLLAERVQHLGFRVARVTSGDRIRNQSLIVERHGKPIYAKAIRDYLGTGTIVSTPNGSGSAGTSSDITVYAARDFGHIGQRRQESRINGGRVHNP
jgi:LCP family protein required for cell wall assembly